MSNIQISELISVRKKAVCRTACPNYDRDDDLFEDGTPDFEPPTDSCRCEDEG